MGRPIDELKMRRAEGWEALHRMVEEFYGLGGGSGGRGRDVWSPPTDVFETETEIVIRMAVPGIRAADVRVIFSGDAITISGCRHARREDDVTAFHQMEIRMGCFERNVVVSVPYDPSNATWSYEEGILSLRVPKAAAVTVVSSCMIRLKL